MPCNFRTVFGQFAQINPTSRRAKFKNTISEKSKPVEGWAAGGRGGGGVENIEFPWVWKKEHVEITGVN